MSDKKSTWLSDKSEGTLIKFKSPTNQMIALGMVLDFVENMPTRLQHRKNDEKASIRTGMLTDVLEGSSMAAAGFAHQTGHEHTLPVHRQSHLSNVSNHGTQQFCLHTDLLAVYCSIKQDIDML